MAVIHISAADASRDFPALLARVRAGVEIVIEDDASPAVVLRLAAERRVRLLSESLRLAKEHGSAGTLDGGFARDLEAAINGHPDPLENPWD
jgi:antitoxin (DNA-binding transcriptional repressor) of toxin-antitoxin stability system